VAPPKKEDDWWVAIVGWLVIGAIWWAISNSGSATPARQNAPPQPAAGPRRAWTAFMSAPLGQAVRRAVLFADQIAQGAGSREAVDRTDVRDAVTGEPLRRSVAVQQCLRCQASYEPPSLEFIRRQNGGRCIACGFIVGAGNHARTTTTDRVHAPGPETTTLANYRARLNQMVVFEGRCVRVLPSQSGTAYAVMFENGAWAQGFKLVIRTAHVAAIGGPQFIQSLAGRTVRVRGVIEHSPVFGYEVNVTNRSMILGVW
jgi:hypothetical protein